MLREYTSDSPRCSVDNDSLFVVGANTALSMFPLDFTATLLSRMTRPLNPTVLTLVSGPIQLCSVFVSVY